MLILFIICIVAVPLYSQDTAEKPVTPENTPPVFISTPQKTLTEKSLTGKWMALVGDEKFELVFGEENSVKAGNLSGTYVIEKDRIIITSDNAGISYKFKLEKDKLTLSEGDLAAPLTFDYQPDVVSFGEQMNRIFDISPSAMKSKFYRIFIIISIVLAARLITFLMKHISKFLIFSEKGPLKLIYTVNKNRKQTVHSISLNVFKYIVYFTAIGFILSEFGVNYTAYLASLSVVGLAIGFGSQDLVKDLVTGFFIFFENQYDVGDMVDLSGKVGVVHDFGLRMTKIRNYEGQIVVLPNRNISAVANFNKGGMVARIDISLDEKDREKAIPLIQSTSQRLEREFQHVVISPPQIEETEEPSFLRLRMVFWPGQQWIIDSELIPGLKSELTKAEITIPGDKVTVFYHAKSPEN